MRLISAILTQVCVSASSLFIKIEYTRTVYCYEITLSFSMNRTAYNAIAKQWHAARKIFFGRERAYLDTFLAELPAASLILDAGCGTGRPMAAYAIKRGWSVIGIDQSENMLAIAKANYPKERWVLGKLEKYPFEAPCGGIICWDALFHIERNFHEAILGRMANCLLANGALMLTVGGSEHPPFTDYMLGQEFFYDSFPPHKILNVLTDLGFHMLISEFMNPPTTGRDKGRYAIVAKKR